MDISSQSSSATRDLGEQHGGHSPGNPHEYLKAHKTRGVPLLGHLELRDCTRLIIYNVQGFSTAQIWTELRGCLGDLARSIVKVKRVSGINRNPHADLWVRKDTGSTLVAVIREQTRTRLWMFVKVVTEAQRRNGITFNTATWGGDELRFAAVTHWRLAIWQSWRERRMAPANTTPFSRLRPNLVHIATWNINGFWRKVKDIGRFVDTEKVAVLALQETLVKSKHYEPRIEGYRAFLSPAKEDFRGMATLVDNKLSAYEVPHEQSWLVHVKVFGYAGWSGPTHILNVYLKSGGNFRRERGNCLNTVKSIINDVIEKDSDSRFVVLGDFNEDGERIWKHLNIRKEGNPLTIAPIVGSVYTRFPVRGQRQALDHILLDFKHSNEFKCARVCRNYNASDHRPVVIRPRKQLPSARVEHNRIKFDNKMIRLCGDMVVNDNSWLRMMTMAYGPENFLGEEINRGEAQTLVSDQQKAFTKTFDTACRKHKVKEDCRPMTRSYYPRKIKALIRVEQRYRKEVEKARKAGTEMKELTVVKLARIQKRLRKAKKEWEIRQKQEFYAQVSDDFIAHDHKNVWNRLNPQLQRGPSNFTLNPIKGKDGVIRYSAREIVAIMKTHYEDLLTYDPDGRVGNDAYWETVEIGHRRAELSELNRMPSWPELLCCIREANRNTATGKDGIHINVLKSMVSEECMMQVALENPGFQRPDNVRIDLPAEKLPWEPLTLMGKAFYPLICNVWRTGCIPEQWSEVQIVNLFKGGDTHDVNNYRGISLISCAFKVLLSLMATRLSRAGEESGLISEEQSGFRKKEEAVAQAVALAEIVRRRWIKGKLTYGAFIDFKKAYDRVYHGLLFRILENSGIRGVFLELVKTMYRETRYEVRAGDAVSESFSPTRGAKQGDPLSPVLFIIYINSCLERSSGSGVATSGRSGMCKGLMYADDVIGLERNREGIQDMLDGVRDWGKDLGMELGRDKCGVIMWPGKVNAQKRKRMRDALDLDLSDCSSVEDDVGNRPDAEELEFQHDHFIYTITEGVIPTVKKYKYLGITIDTRLGDPRRIISGKRSMELEFAYSQATKGMKILHSLRPFLTDRFCPMTIKTAMVRNLIYSKMLYGSELIGFQAVHAEPMQRVINVAAKWIMGLQSKNTLTDAFTICFELGLPPVHQEMCALRARLNYKLEAHTDGGLRDWLQKLYDSPPTDLGTSHTWVTLSRKWLRELSNDMSKYNRTVTLIDWDGTLRLVYNTDHAAPLRPWAQLGKAFEMSVRANSYTSETLRGLRAAFYGQTSEGEPPRGTLEAPLIRPEYGELVDAEWDLPAERLAMDRGRLVPQGRTRGEITKVSLVRDTVLERMMSSNTSKGFNQFYDCFSLGTTRGFLREATNRPDLAEGVRWLSMIRTRAFPTVEGAWQRIKRSGKTPWFERGKCPLCMRGIRLGWEWTHLLIECTSVVVRYERQKHLQPSITYIERNLGNRGHQVNNYADVMGREGQIGFSEVLSICLIGGLFRPVGLSDGEGWFDAYFVGFGATRMLCPGFESYGFTYIASFLQRVAPRWAACLGEEPLIFGDEADTAETLSVGSEGRPIDQRHNWFTEGNDPEIREGYVGSDLLTGVE
jgi:exonuclease III